MKIKMMTAASFEVRVDPLEANRAIIGTTLNNRIIEFLLGVMKQAPPANPMGQETTKGPKPFENQHLPISFRRRQEP